MVDLADAGFYNYSKVKLSLFSKGLILLLVAILLVGGMIFVNRILAGDAFNKEEASHALYALWLVKDLKALDLNAFWYDTQRQMIWPFLHSWLLAIFFFVFGVGYTSARLMSLLFFSLSMVLIYLLSAKMLKRDGPRVGLLAVALAATSPLMLRFAAQNMLEGLGAFLFLAAAYAYLVAEERKLTLYYIPLAFLIGLSIYTNYLYAYLLLPAFMVATLSKLGPILVEAIRLSRKGEKAAIPFIWWAFKKLIVLLVLLLFAAAWFSFSFSRKILLLIGSIFKYSGGVEVKGLWQGLLYYPKVIISECSFSPWLGIFLLISLFLPFVASRYRGLHKLFIYVWTILLLLILTIPAKAPQMIYIILPFIFIIFSASLFYVLDFLQSKNRRLAVILLLFLLIPVLPSIPRAYGILFPARPAENMIQVLDYFKTSVPKDASMAMLLNLQHLNPEGIRFHFRDRKAPLLADPYMTERELFDEAEYFPTLELDRETFYRKEVLDDSLFRWNTWLRGKWMNGEVELYSSKRFESIGVAAKIYRKTSSAR